MRNFKSDGSVVQKSGKFVQGPEVEKSKPVKSWEPPNIDSVFEGIRNNGVTPDANDASAQPTIETGFLAAKSALLDVVDGLNGQVNAPLRSGEIMMRCFDKKLFRAHRPVSSICKRVIIYRSTCE